ncbi:hypothetical protein BDQ17DRAFT_411281 [Cyathus striatus]|nr:hypothetical protein BDQ17DRAFT_411281 [Cyathus striatus]
MGYKRLWIHAVCRLSPEAKYSVCVELQDCREVNKYSIGLMSFGFPPEVWKNHLDGIASKVPLQDILTPSYYVLIPSERATIQDLTSSTEETIQALKTELTYHRAAVELLQTRLSNAHTLLNFQRSLLALIRNLPTDLLSNIFVYVCSGDILDIGCSTGPIWDLQQVYMRWREVGFQRMPYYSAHYGVS